MNKVTLVNTPDGNWEMVYVNGERVIQNEMITAWTLLKQLEQYLPVGESECKELTFDACNKFDYEFPKSLTGFAIEDFR